MKVKKIIPAILLCILLNETGCKKTPANDETGGSHTKKYTAEVATSWFTLLTSITKTNPYPPAPSSRLFAYVGMALYESVVPGMPSYQSMYKYFTGNTIDFDSKKNYYWPASANAAIARIASHILGNYSPNPNLVPIQQLETTFNNSFQPLLSSEELQFSNEFGQSVADKIYEWSKTDGTLNPDGTLAVCPTYIPLSGPGNWVPTPPAFANAAGACQGSLRTFIPNIVNTTLPAGPPAYSTDPTSAFYQAANEIYQISLNRTQDDINICQHWRDLVGTNYHTPSHMLKLTSEIITKDKLNLEDASVVYAKVSIAIFDAIAALFKAKFHYAALRPITYIRNVMGFTAWNSLYPTPAHPAYPASAICAAAAGAAILKKTFGTNYSFIDSTQKALYGSWTYSSFDGLVQDAGRSRTHSGINFKFAVDAAIIQGGNVGQMIYQLPFKKL